MHSTRDCDVPRPCIAFRTSWDVSFRTISRTSSGGQIACWLVPITLAGRVRGRVVLSPWLAEGVGTEPRAKIATRARNDILRQHFVLFLGRLKTTSVPNNLPIYTLHHYPHTSGYLMCSCCRHGEYFHCVKLIGCSNATVYFAILVADK